MVFVFFFIHLIYSQFSFKRLSPNMFPAHMSIFGVFYGNSSLHIPDLHVFVCLSFLRSYSILLGCQLCDAHSCARRVFLLCNSLHYLLSHTHTLAARSVVPSLFGVRASVMCIYVCKSVAVSHSLRGHVWLPTLCMCQHMGAPLNTYVRIMYSSVHVCVYACGACLSFLSFLVS
jgi:hypothetical protein